MWYHKLEFNSIISDNFRLLLDIDNNLKFIREETNRQCVIWIRYDHESKLLYTPYCSIVFLEFQKLWADLCYEAISGKINFIPETSFHEWKKDHCFNATINTDEKVSTSTDEITSKYVSPSIFAATQDDSDFIEFTDYERYKLLLEKYYNKVAIPFFSDLPTIYELDNLTDDMDIYSLSCYLTQIPVLKKILLMHLTDNPKKTIYTSNYKRQLRPHLNREKVAAIMSSVEKIESHFSSV